MKLREIIIYTAILILSLSLNFYLYFLRDPLIKEVKEYVEKKDTVIYWKFSTDTVYVKDTKYKDIYHYDTIHQNNVVYIRDTLNDYRFTEPDYTLDINAVRLDNYKLDIHKSDTITTTTTIYKTEYKNKKNTISIGVQCGYGLGLETKHVEPYVGLGVQINLFQK